MNTGVVLDIDPLMLKSMNNYVSLYIESLIRERESSFFVIQITMCTFFVIFSSYKESLWLGMRTFSWIIVVVVIEDYLQSAIMEEDS